MSTKLGRVSVPSLTEIGRLGAQKWPKLAKIGRPGAQRPLGVVKRITHLDAGSGPNAAFCLHSSTLAYSESELGSGVVQGWCALALLLFCRVCSVRMPQGASFCALIALGAALTLCCFILLHDVDPEPGPQGSSQPAPRVAQTLGPRATHTQPPALPSRFPQPATRSMVGAVAEVPTASSSSGLRSAPTSTGSALGSREAANGTRAMASAVRPLLGDPQVRCRPHLLCWTSDPVPCPTRRVFGCPPPHCSPLV